MHANQQDSYLKLCTNEIKGNKKNLRCQKNIDFTKLFKKLQGTYRKSEANLNKSF